MIKPAPPFLSLSFFSFSPAPARFVDFMTRVALEEVLPHKSVTQASDSRKTRHEYRKNAIISYHCSKLPPLRERTMSAAHSDIMNC